MLPVRITFRKSANTEALASGLVHSKLLELNFIPVDPISRAFRRAIRDEEFDVTEMALVTLAMAHDLGKPWTGLPLVMMRGFHHAALRTKIDSALGSPHDLPGKRIGVRAYSQTTGVWLRGILQSEYGIAPNQMTWLTTEDAHVPNFLDPPFVSRAPESVKLQSLFLAGDVDAVIGDSSSNFGETRSVIPDPETAARQWFEKTGVVPVNHVMAVRSDLADEHPWLPAEIERLFAESARLVKEPQPEPEGPQRSIELGLTFAFDQGLTKTRHRFGDLFRHKGSQPAHIS